MFKFKIGVGFLVKFNFVTCVQECYYYFLPNELLRL